MNLQTAPYAEQLSAWPSSGRHIMAQYDEATVVVYQAFRRSIGHFAAAHQRFGGDFSFGRMSWIKPNFLWMMFRCGWATKPDQECVLAIRLKRDGFDEILSAAVHSAFTEQRYSSEKAWSDELKSSTVRLQWDPDHDPLGNRVERRAIQLGLSGDTLRKYATDWVVEIQDISNFVEQQRTNATDRISNALVVPVERAYLPQSSTIERLGIETAIDRNTAPRAT